MERYKDGVLEITDESFRRHVLEAGGPVVVDFWAPWCRPCKAVERVLEELEAEHADRLSFARVNIDEHPEYATEYGVLSIPTVILFDRGQPEETVTGARPRRYFERRFARWLA